jgi:TolA-binding protein
VTEDSEPEPALEAPPRPAASAAKMPVADPGLELYRAAHRLHFEAGDPSGALSAWERYLRETPRGRFAVEATYNRAICLVRLGRAEEARRVLEPFARGAYGAYRQESAQALLDALGGS